MWRWLLVTLLCGAVINSGAYKRAELSPSPFLLSSRYGRSPQHTINPRNERFFMSSRYGKRADPETVSGSGYRFNYDIVRDIINTNGRDRDRVGVGEGERVRPQEILEKWKPKCDCSDYGKAPLFRNYYKRVPETADLASEEN